MATLKEILDSASLSSGFGSHSAASIEQLRGLNQLSAGSHAPSNRDMVGHTFYTKPNLNLSYDNIRYLSSLAFMNGGPRTLGAAIRCMLSPYVSGATQGNWSGSTMGQDPNDPRSEITDDRCAFITPFTNSITEISGFPPLEAEIASTPEGLRKEVQRWVDDNPEDWTPISISMTCRNAEGDTIKAMVAAWIHYMRAVAVGRINPYPRCIIEKEIDYQTTCFRLVMDPSGRYVRKCAQTAFLIPSAIDAGADFNFSQQTMVDNQTVSVQFEGAGWIYNDPIVIFNFNTIVKNANPTMHDEVRKSNMVYINPELLSLFRGRKTYPYISDGYELEWWTTKEEVAAVEAINNINIPIGLSLGG